MICIKYKIMAVGGPNQVIGGQESQAPPMTISTLFPSENLALLKSLQKSLWYL